jgi:aclacinomycin oxidase
MTDVTQFRETTTGPARTAVPANGPGTIPAGDPRYPSLLRGQNHRFVGNPDYVCIVTSVEDVVDALNRAVAQGKRFAVRGGGHGFEDFTATPDIEVLLDMSAMNEVSYDPQQHAFAIEPGATLGHVYTVLFKGWGVTIPAGECSEVGAGGHLCGGGYGPLSRRYGSVVDYLHAVEVVVVGADGKAKVVVATRDPDDLNHDLWWAHTGGGGGNFGVVTRYWVRSPGVTSADPADLLPRAPSMSRTEYLTWPWSSLDKERFARIMNNLSGFLERNSDPGTPYAPLSAFFHGSGRNGGVMVGGTIDDGLPNAEELLSSYFDAVAKDVGVELNRMATPVQPWLFTMSFPGFGDLGDHMTRRFKIKAAYLRRGYTERQIDVIYRYLTTQDADPSLILIGYGGDVNGVDPAATATAQRDSVFKVIYISVWADPAEDDSRIARIREFYRDVYADTGGVPVPNEVSDGSYINYPDVDLADPEWNTSGVPWHTLYYKDNYPRLQRVKRRYDPLNVFRHKLSITPQ